MKLGERIRIERTKKHLSQAALGDMVNVSQQAVGKWEKSLAEPDSETLIELSKIFEVSLSYLLKGIEDEESVSQESVQIPDKYSDVFVALNDGDQDLTQDDVDDIVRFIEFRKSVKKK